MQRRSSVLGLFDKDIRAIAVKPDGAWGTLLSQCGLGATLNPLSAIASRRA